MAEGDACLLGRNILLRISKRDDPHNAVIVEALKMLVVQGVRPLLHIADPRGILERLYPSARQKRLEHRGNRSTRARDRAGISNCCPTAWRRTNIGVRCLLRTTFRAYRFT